jgi:inner membrane protein
MAVSLFLVILAVFGGVDLSGMILPYAGIFVAFLAMRLTTFCITRTALHGNGRAIPTINPLRWLVIREIPEAWTVSDYQIGKGMGEPAYFMKYRLTSAGETSALLMLPEVRRLQFHSSVVIAEKVGDAIIFSDPLRESGRIFYPPHYTRVRIPLPE